MTDEITYSIGGGKMVSYSDQQAAIKQRHMTDDLMRKCQQLEQRNAALEELNADLRRQCAHWQTDANVLSLQIATMQANHQAVVDDLLRKLGVKEAA